MLRVPTSNSSDKNSLTIDIARHYFYLLLYIFLAHSIIHLVCSLQLITIQTFRHWVGTLHNCFIKYGEGGYHGNVHHSEADEVVDWVFAAIPIERQREPQGEASAHS